LRLHNVLWIRKEMEIQICSAIIDEILSFNANRRFINLILSVNYGRNTLIKSTPITFDIFAVDDPLEGTKKLKLHLTFFKKVLCVNYGRNTFIKSTPITFDFFAVGKNQKF
jgi:hypothetical protein